MDGFPVSVIVYGVPNSNKYKPDTGALDFSTGLLVTNWIWLVLAFKGTWKLNSCDWFSDCSYSHTKIIITQSHLHYSKYIPHLHHLFWVPLIFPAHKSNNEEIYFLAAEGRDHGHVCVTHHWILELNELLTSVLYSEEEARHLNQVWCTSRMSMTSLSFPPSVLRLSPLSSEII